ncbi:MAG: hypothetical protein Q9172_001631 [Xanthocarpia lactea]
MPAFYLPSLSPSNAFTAEDEAPPHTECIGDIPFQAAAKSRESNQPLPQSTESNHQFMTTEEDPAAAEGSPSFLPSSIRNLINETLLRRDPCNGRCIDQNPGYGCTDASSSTGIPSGCVPDPEVFRRPRRGLGRRSRRRGLSHPADHAPKGSVDLAIARRTASQIHDLDVVNNIVALPLPPPLSPHNQGQIGFFSGPIISNCTTKNVDEDRGRNDGNDHTDIEHGCINISPDKSTYMDVSTETKDTGDQERLMTNFSQEARPTDEDGGGKDRGENSEERINPHGSEREEAVRYSNPNDEATNLSDPAVKPSNAAKERTNRTASRYTSPRRMRYKPLKVLSENDNDDGGPTKSIEEAKPANLFPISSTPGSGLECFPRYDEMRKMVGGKSCGARFGSWLWSRWAYLTGYGHGGYEKL